MSFTDSMWSFFSTASCWRTLFFVFIIDWLIGILFIQYFYHITTKLRSLGPKAKAKYAPYINQVELWNRFVHSFFSFFLVPRFALLATAVTIMWVVVRIINIGRPTPLLGWRRKVMIFTGSIIGRLILFGMSFVSIRFKDIDIDYSQWLGTNWTPPKQAPSILVSNHRGSMVLCSLSLRMYFCIRVHMNFQGSSHLLK